MSKGEKKDNNKSDAELLMEAILEDDYKGVIGIIARNIGNKNEDFLNYVNEDGNSFLMNAVANGNLVTLDFLCVNLEGLNLLCQNNKNQTVIDLVDDKTFTYAKNTMWDSICTQRYKMSREEKTFLGGGIEGVSNEEDSDDLEEEPVLNEELAEDFVEGSFVNDFDSGNDADIDSDSEPRKSPLRVEASTIVSSTNRGKST